MRAFVAGSLAAFAISIVWLFWTGRLYEPDAAWRILEMSVAVVFAVLGIVQSVRELRTLH